MTKTILTTIILTISASANSNDIDINFGCLDCNKIQNETKQKEINKKPKEKPLFKNIEIDGNTTIRFEKSN